MKIPHGNLQVGRDAAARKAGSRSIVPSLRRPGRRSSPQSGQLLSSSDSPTLLQTEPRHRAFSLIEVMVATTIFFMAMFSILGVLCAGIHAASILRTSGPTAGMAAGYYYVTNKIEEGNDSGDFGDIAGYQGYQWRSSATEVATNGLFQMEFVVIDPHGNPSSTLNVLIYNPASSSRQHMGLQPPR
jgi:hypothetical protein